MVFMEPWTFIAIFTSRGLLLNLEQFSSNLEWMIKILDNSDIDFHATECHVISTLIFAGESPFQWKMSLKIEKILISHFILYSVNLFMVNPGSNMIQISALKFLPVDMLREC